MTHGTLGMDVKRLAKDAQTAICIFSINTRSRWLVYPLNKQYEKNPWRKTARVNIKSRAVNSYVYA